MIRNKQQETRSKGWIWIVLHLNIYKEIWKAFELKIKHFNENELLRFGSGINRENKAMANFLFAFIVAVVDKQNAPIKMKFISDHAKYVLHLKQLNLVNTIRFIDSLNCQTTFKMCVTNKWFYLIHVVDKMPTDKTNGHLFWNLVIGSIAIVWLIW